MNTIEANSLEPHAQRAAALRCAERWAWTRRTLSLNLLNGDALSARPRVSTDLRRLHSLRAREGLGKE